MELITADEARGLCGFNERVNNNLEKISEVIRDCAMDGMRAVTYPLCCDLEEVQTIADRLRRNGFDVYGEDDWKHKGLLHILW